MFAAKKNPAAEFHEEGFFFDAATVVEVVKFEAAQGWAALPAAVRKRDVFVGGAAFFAYFLSPPKESRLTLQN